MTIFLDTNIFIAACGSESGGSRYLFRIAEKTSSRLRFFTTKYALEEARRNITTKMPDSLDVFALLLTCRALTIVEEAPTSLIQEAETVIIQKDAPILAACFFSHAEILCTLDKKDFHTKGVRAWCKKFGIQVLFPGDVLEQLVQYR